MEAAIRTNGGGRYLTLSLNTPSFYIKYMGGFTEKTDIDCCRQDQGHVRINCYTKDLSTSSINNKKPFCCDRKNMHEVLTYIKKIL